MITKYLFSLVAVLVIVTILLLLGMISIPGKTVLDIDEFKRLTDTEQVEYLNRASEEISILELRNFIKLAYPEEPNNKHELAHKIGELAINKGGIAGFGICNSLLQFGCFHGAALSAVRIMGNDPNLASKLWEGCRASTKSPGVCLHGLGHAIMMIKQYNLVEAYEECKGVLVNEQDAFWCQDGVSMENITRSMANNNIGAYGDRNDIYYPCNSISRQYEIPCVRNHAGHLLRTNKLSFTELMDYCFSFNERTSEECVHFAGSIIAEENMDNSTEILSKCQLAGKFNSFCIEGAVVNNSISGRFDRAKELCDTLIDNEQEDCLGRIDSIAKLIE